MYGTLNDPHFIFLALSCAAVITIGSLVTALNRIPRAEFARLQNDLKELSERVRVLDAAEQRRLVMELNSHSEGAEAKYATNGSGGLDPQAEDQTVAAAKVRGTRRRAAKDTPPVE
jgi:hypothetical protein